MLALCEVQIQRSLGNNVVEVEDVLHLWSMPLVQTCLINGNPAVLLNRRPLSGHGKPGMSHCLECERGIQDEACRFYSVECKVRHLAQFVVQDVLHV